MTDGPAGARAARYVAILAGFGVLAVAPIWTAWVSSLVFSSLSTLVVFLFGVWLLRRSAASPDFAVAAWLLLAAVSAGLWLGYLERDEPLTQSASVDSSIGWNQDGTGLVSEELVEDGSMRQFLCPSAGGTTDNVFVFESGSIDGIVAVAVGGAPVANRRGSASSVSSTHLAYADATEAGRVLVELVMTGESVYSHRFQGIVTATAVAGSADVVFVLTNNLGRTEISSWDPRVDEVKQFYSGRAEVSSLAVSADGSKVAWSEGPRRSSRVLIADTSVPIPIDVVAGRDPSWSVGGGSLVYSAEFADGAAIFGIDIASRETRRLTEPIDQVHSQPALSSDCTKVAYVRSEADGSVDLWQLVLGGEATEIASGEGAQHNPSFGHSN